MGAAVCTMCPVGEYLRDIVPVQCLQLPLGIDAANLKYNSVSNIIILNAGNMATIGISSPFQVDTATCVQSGRLPGSPEGQTGLDMSYWYTLIINCCFNQNIEFF